MSEEEDKKEEDDELQITLAQAVRPPKPSELQQILATELAIAIFSANPLQKIRHIFEAYFLLPQKEREELFPDKDQRTKIRMLYELCISFQNVVEVPGPPGWTGRYATMGITFPFNKASEYMPLMTTRSVDLSHVYSDWNEFLELRDPRNWFAKKYEDDEAKINEALRDEKAVKAAQKAWWDSYCQMVARWLTSGLAPLSAIKQLESEYVTSTMPFSLNILRTIHSKYITQEVWEQTLELFRGKTKGLQQP